MSDYSDENYYTDQPLPRKKAAGKTTAQGQAARKNSIFEGLQASLMKLFGSDLWESIISKPSEEEKAGIPDKLNELWKICRRTQWSPVRNRDFYNQALFAANCEDSVPDIAPFFSMNPVYSDMSMPQMRSYFTLRKGWRKGEFPVNISLSYVVVYAYELLMQVGFILPEEGLKKLEELRDHYGVLDWRLMRNLKEWMRDYVVFYGMIDRAEEYFAEEQEEDRAVELLDNLGVVSDEALFGVIAPFSTYNIKNSKLYKRHAEVVARVSGRVIRATAPILEKRYGLSASKLYIGELREVPQQLFHGAVFYRRYPYRKRFYPMTKERGYSCLKGIWKKEMYCSVIGNEKRGELAGKLLRETDRLLRRSMKGEGKLSERMQDAALTTAIQKEIDRYWAEQREAQLAAEREAAREAAQRARDEVEVDLSRLDRIRSDADAVREALLTDDDRAEASQSAEKQAAPPLLKTETEATAAADTSFTEQERRFLRLLIEGGDWADYLRNIRVPVGVMTEGINEKMMEELQDVVVADQGQGPEVIEDYLDDVRRRL